MKTTLALVALVASLGLSTGAEPCCMYNQFETKMYGKTAQYDKQQETAQIFDLDITLSSDYDKKKVYLNERVVDVAHPNPQDFKILMDYNANVQYLVFNGQCQKMQIDMPLIPPCIPKTATFLSSASYSGVQADTWAYGLPLRNRQFDMRVTVSEDNCVPLSSAIADFGDVKRLTTINYMNLTQGIVDPSVFNVPPECQHTVKHIPRPSNQAHFVPVLMFEQE